jgi:predicted nuclease with TOPRIM domain
MKQTDRKDRMIAELKKELEKVTIENNELIDKCMEPEVELSELIETLKQINTEWSATLKDIQKARDEYWQLNKELREFRNKMIGSTRLQRLVNKKLP